MEILRKLRWVLYPSVFLLVFLFASYCTFPKAVVRDFAESIVTNAAINMGPVTRGSPKVAIQDVGLWRVSGMDLSGVKVTWPATKKDAPLVIDVDQLKSRLSIFPLLVGRKSVATYANFYSGMLESSLSINKQNSISALDASLSKLDLAKMPFLESAIGAPLKGLLTLVIDLNANTELIKDGTGTLSLNVDKGVFGPGAINLPEGGFVPTLSVPQVAFGNVVAKFALDKGQLESKTFTLSGGDLEADMQVSVNLGRIPQSSRLNGKGWFSLKKEFINANETIKMLFDLLPELRSAAQGDGKVGFSLRGTLARPQFKLENYVASAATAKAPVPAPPPKAKPPH